MNLFPFTMLSCYRILKFSSKKESLINKSHNADFPQCSVWLLMWIPLLQSKSMGIADLSGTPCGRKGPTMCITLQDQGLTLEENNCSGGKILLASSKSYILSIVLYAFHICSPATEDYFGW